MNFIFIADFFSDQILGGGELNNDEVVLELIRRGHKVAKINSHIMTPKIIHDNKDAKFIVANFVNLPSESRDALINTCSYVIYEHDHKYLKTRDPANYPDYKAPESDIINVEFYRSAKKVLCQSSFHQSIIEKNTGLNNVENLSGNLWSDSSLQIMEQIATKDKRDICSIMNSTIPHKNTRGAIQFCEVKNLKFELISSKNYWEFLESIGNNKRFVFFPKTPETLSRVAVEARMMNMSVILNDKIGASHEPWFKLKGVELVEEVRKMKARIIDTVIEAFK